MNRRQRRRAAVPKKPLAPGWSQRRLEVLGLVLILVVGAWVHWIYASTIDIGSDDVLLMEGSRKIDAGMWRQIWAPQHVHFVPLYRLVRLPFDLHFPAWYIYFHALVVCAHLASTALLYLLARRYLHSKWAALLTAALFAWATVGYEALVWKAAAPFVFSWTFLLLCAWCLTRQGNVWTAASAAALFCAVGFFSGALFAIPGLCLWSWLLEPHSRRRMLGICLVVGLLGSAGWLASVLPTIDFTHYWTFGDKKASPSMRVLWGSEDTWRAYLHQLGIALGAVELRYLFFFLLAASLFLLRDKLPHRWILTVFVLTLLPLLVIMLIRKEPEVWKVSRYAYQSYVFWVVVLASFVDGVLRKLEPWRGWRIGALALSLLGVGYYLGQHAGNAAEVSRRLQPDNQQRFWFGWETFFRLASEHRAQLGAPLYVPSLQILPGLDLQTIYWVCHPRGLPGIVVQPGKGASPQEQDQFWMEIERARPQIPWLPQRVGAAGHSSPDGGK